MRIENQMSSQIIVSVATPPLILGVETNQETFFGHKPRDLYKVPLGVLFGPRTNQDVVAKKMEEAVIRRQISEFITEFYAFGTMAKTMVISVYPCTHDDSLPPCCIMVLNEKEAVSLSTPMDETGAKTVNQTEVIYRFLVPKDSSAKTPDFRDLWYFDDL